MVFKEMEWDDISIVVATYTIPVVGAWIAKEPVVLDSPLLSAHYVVEVNEGGPFWLWGLTLNTACFNGASGPFVKGSVVVIVVGVKVYHEA